MTGFLQGNTANTTNTGVTLAFSGAVAAGSTLVTAVRIGGHTTAVSISDSVNGAWGAPVIFQEDAGLDNLLVFTFPDTAAGTPTLTLTFNNGNFSVRWWIAEYNVGGSSGGAVDASNSQNIASTGTWATPAITTANANDILIAVGEGNGGGGTITDNASGSNPSSGWNQRANVATQKLWASDNIVSSTGSTYGETWTISPADSGADAIIALKIAGGGGSVIVPMPLLRGRRVH